MALALVLGTADGAASRYAPRVTPWRQVKVIVMAVAWPRVVDRGEASARQTRMDNFKTDGDRAFQHEPKAVDT
jgi:hypothetical protein